MGPLHCCTVDYSSFCCCRMFIYWYCAHTMPHWQNSLFSVSAIKCAHTALIVLMPHSNRAQIMRYKCVLSVQYECVMHTVWLRMRLLRLCSYHALSVILAWYEHGWHGMNAFYRALNTALTQKQAIFAWYDHSMGVVWACYECGMIAKWMRF